MQRSLKQLQSLLNLLVAARKHAGGCLQGPYSSGTFLTFCRRIGLVRWEELIYTGTYKEEAPEDAMEYYIGLDAAKQYKGKAAD